MGKNNRTVNLKGVGYVPRAHTSWLIDFKFEVAVVTSFDSLEHF